MRNRQRQLFEFLASTTPAHLTTLTKALLVLSSRRSGSSMFCDTLSRTGLIGLCEEWFNPSYMKAYMDVVKPDHPFRLKCYFRFIACHTIGDTGVFAIHAQVNQLLNMKEQFGAGIDCMTFDHIVRIRRRDKVAQGVSLAKALMSQAWRYDETPKIVDVTVDDCHAAYVDSCMEDHVIDTKYAGLVDDTYYYEDFSQPFHSDSYNRVLTALGKPTCKYYSTRLQRQRDQNSTVLADLLRKRLNEDPKILIPDQPASLGE